MNNISQTSAEFDKRYKYCFEELEKHYQECFTCDLKSPEWYYWLNKADTLDKIIKGLSLCSHDAKYIANLYKELEEKENKEV